VMHSPATVVGRSFDLQPLAARTATAAVKTRATWRRHTARLSRWLHIYGSMISFAVVLFFSATGMTLNHPQWFAGHERLTERTGQMNAAWLAGADDAVARLDIVESLRTTHGITGAVSDFRVDDREASVAFKGPGYSADAVIDRTTGRYALTESRLGLVAILNDLHKGRDTGGVWKFVLDVSAGLLCFVSLSGLVLLFFMQKHRLAGVLLLMFGGAATYAVYVIAVP